MKFLILSSLFIPLVLLPKNNNPSFAKIVSTERSQIVDRKWEMQEIRFLYDNVPYYYNRDDYSVSNMNFDNDNIIFYSDGSGIYHQSDNLEFQLKWHFIKCKNNDVNFTISKFRNNSDLIVNWENIELSTNSIKYTEYYTHENGLHTLGYGIRISKDTSCTEINL